MKRTHLANFLWGEKAHTGMLVAGAVLLLFTFLGAKDIWTQEHRWADIVVGMFNRHDFFHPYLGNNYYYDKPLLSYWLIAFFSLITGEITSTVLRLPSALSGLIAVYSLYLLGSKLRNRSFGLLSAWIMLTSYYFLFWARTSSADMLNLSGTLVAITWYFYHAQENKFFNYVVFFIILGITSLCKGLVGAIVPLMAVFIDLSLRKTIRYHCNWRLFVAIVPAFCLYLLPFLISSLYAPNQYAENGLYLVYRENILRYFQPFDHIGSIYTYFIFFPVYLLPWSIFLFPASYTLISRHKTMDVTSKWICWSLLILFLFFTFSGSRRSYYVLPLVPFGVLYIADWAMTSLSTKSKTWLANVFIFAFCFTFLAIDIAPAYYYANYGVSRFASVLKMEAEKIKPWQTWNITLLDPESKLLFYLNLPPTLETLNVNGDRDKQTRALLQQVWPLITKKPANTIFISRKLYEPLLAPFFSDYQLVEIPSSYLARLIAKTEDDTSIAYIPKLNSGRA